MATLYGELTSDKGGRVASKGGNTFIKATLFIGNDTHARVLLRTDGSMEIFNGKGDLVAGIEQWKLK